jgi:hypothetical protein
MRMGNLCPIPNLFLLVFAFAGFGTLFPQGLHAQGGSIHWTVKDSFQVGYQLSTDSDTIPAHTQFYVDLHLETFEQTEVLGAYFVFQLPDLVNPSSSDAYSLPAPNPLGETQDLTVSATWNAQTQQSNSAVWRSDGVPQPVAGNVLRLHFVTGNLSVATDNLVQTFDGGLVMEENADLKTAELEVWDSPATVIAYPNPCREWLAIDLPYPEAGSYTLRDLNGRVWKSGAAVPGIRIDLDHVPSGVLILDVRDAWGRSILVEKIVKQ